MVARDADMLRQEIVFNLNPSVQWSEIYIVVSETFSLTVTGCNFTQNGLSIKSTAVTGTSLTNGGGCFAVSNTTGAIAIHNSNFNANQVGSGANGGVFLCYQCRGPITITSSAFSSNSAGGQGGALNLYYTNSKKEKPFLSPIRIYYSQAPCSFKTVRSLDLQATSKAEASAIATRPVQKGSQ